MKENVYIGILMCVGGLVLSTLKIKYANFNGEFRKKVIVHFHWLKSINI